jgi:prenyltransferase/squalene oxidase-like repeat protein
VTNQQSELDRQTGGHEERVEKAPAAAPGALGPGGSPDPITAGLNFLFSRRQQQSWTLGSLPGQESAWVTGYVLARLGEIPSHRINYALRQKIEKSLDWLLETRTRSGGWGFSSGAPDDADSTSWAVVALRQHGRLAPEGALELVRSCRRSDGGFSILPDAAHADDASRPSAPDVTAIAVRALASIDAASSEFLAAHLRTDIPGTHCRLASAVFVSSTLLDWEPGMAPWFVVNAVRELLSCRQTGEGAWDQALRLRCMMRLGMQSAWALSAGLRRLQQPDGSWPGSVQPAELSAQGIGPLIDGQGVLATVTSLSALAMGDLQPGLYFGSDLPFRRL